MTFDAEQKHSDRWINNHNFNFHYYICTFAPDQMKQMKFLQTLFAFKWLFICCLIIYIVLWSRNEGNKGKMFSLYKKYMRISPIIIDIHIERFEFISIWIWNHDLATSRSEVFALHPDDVLGRHPRRAFCPPEWEEFLWHYEQPRSDAGDRGSQGGEFTRSGGRLLQSAGVTESRVASLCSG